MTPRMNTRDDEHLILFPPKRGEALDRLEAFVLAPAGGTRTHATGIRIRSCWNGRRT